MRSVLSATWMAVALGLMLPAAAQAQMTPPATAARPVTTVPVRPAAQTPADTIKALSQAERLTLQSHLAWTGLYNGAISGDVSERMLNAIKEFQKSIGGMPTGVLNQQERGTLIETARKKQENVGWKIVADPGTGVRLGLPLKLVPQQTSDANGTRWAAANGSIQVQLARRKEAEPTAAKLADLEKKVPGRKIDYSLVRPDFFVLAGLQEQRKFYIRGTFRGDEVRILTVLYVQAIENIVDPVVIAMSSAFTAFPAPVQNAGPPPRKNVEYGTGLVVSDDGAILVDRQVTDGCVTIAIAGHGNADRVADSKEHDLALLRIYGARGLKALDLAKPTTRTGLGITGIADPQDQGGRAAVTRVNASVAQPGASNTALAPAPPTGFSGAAAQDDDGRFAGMVLLKPVQLAGPANGAPVAQAVLVSAETLRSFLKANGVSPAGGSTDAKASVVRVICVRK
jgi:hypothetical protein